jgi:hypothetical protein
MEFFMAYIRPVNAIIGAAVGWFLGNYDGVFYALVKGGVYAINSTDNTANLPVVPEAYQLKVAEYLAAQATA